jgi:hypothetical protein
MAAPAEAKSLIKREPVAIATGALTLLATAVYVLPSIGIKVPDKVQKGLTLLGILAQGLGIRSLVKPA